MPDFRNTDSFNLSMFQKLAHESGIVLFSTVDCATYTVLMYIHQIELFPVRVRFMKFTEPLSFTTLGVAAIDRLGLNLYGMYTTKLSEM